MVLCKSDIWPLKSIRYDGIHIEMDSIYINSRNEADELKLAPCQIQFIVLHVHFMMIYVLELTLTATFGRSEEVRASCHQVTVSEE